ncbi:hypothetical protein AVEN_62995-1 [Araneus ventricosus]|uniref:Uncharacterized protein n=1 Tax=Araneus ventricosus TaxID=182803 RepID=A0A4Y2CQM3_ARAVE|nr:hypothetical protein AVEN_62995-1 [Araneus ventricosus]
MSHLKTIQSRFYLPTDLGGNRNYFSPFVFFTRHHFFFTLDKHKEANGIGDPLGDLPKYSRQEGKKKERKGKKKKAPVDDFRKERRRRGRRMTDCYIYSKRPTEISHSTFLFGDVEKKKSAEIHTYAKRGERVENLSAETNFGSEGCRWEILIPSSVMEFLFSVLGPKQPHRER